jgi:osmotically-inducible protein OsmY
MAMRSDSEIKQDVEAELRWDPEFDSSDIGVSVKDSVVALNGFVHSYWQKWRAEKIAKRVKGVFGVANDIEVRLPIFHERPDPEIARDAVTAIRNELPDEHEEIKVTVKDAWITLEGEVQWHYQKERAKKTVQRIRGVKGVHNRLTVRPAVTPGDIKRQIEDALRRAAEIDASRVTVSTDGGNVTLRGTVRSWAEKDEAERVAWRAPGVTSVLNFINVDR